MNNEPFDMTVEIRDAENIGVRTGEAGPVNKTEVTNREFRTNQGMV